MDVKNILISLSNEVAIGTVNAAVDIADKYLSPIAECKKLGGLSALYTMKGENDYTILIDAHIDEIGMIVTSVSDDGFVTVAKCGGIDLRLLASKEVVIHGKTAVKGVFVSTPPHLNGEDAVPNDICELKIDTGLKNAKETINPGDFVTFNTVASALCQDTVCGKSLDNRAGVTCLVELADRLKDKKLPCNVAFLLSDGEELGLRGVRTAVFDSTPNEAIVIDVSFGDGPDISPYKCGKMGKGAMIGVSPVLNREMTDALNLIAYDNGIPYQNEVMGGNTSTNADVISVTKCGVPTALISIPLRNMHTPVETVKISDITSVCDILERYVLSGGALNG